MDTKKNAILLEERYGAHNYKPLPIVICRGLGVHLWDEAGKQYIDMMSAYSAVSLGHCNPRLIKVLTDQAHRLCVISRAYYSDKLGPFLERACQLTGMDEALPMNSGAEAVETAIKAARKWGYSVKGIPENKAEIITCLNNFHGRTTTIISFSSEPQYRCGFGPYTPGFKLIPYGDIQALEKTITPNTAAFLVEPIQGEAGIIVPPTGYLKACEEICRKNNVLLICDEIQTGLARTGKFLACEYDHVKPDGLILGKALGGGMYPVSLFLAKESVMEVFSPGDHGSTFGGNPLASALGYEALGMLNENNLCEHVASLGEYLISELKKIKCAAIRDIRGRGLFVGVEFDPKQIAARAVCLKLMEHGILSKETHDTVVRLAPPLVIAKAELTQAIGILKTVFESLE